MTAEPIYHPLQFLYGVGLGGPLVGAILLLRNDRVLGRRRPRWFTVLAWALPLLEFVATRLLRSFLRNMPADRVFLGIHGLVVAGGFLFALRSQRTARHRHPPAQATEVSNIIVLCLLANVAVYFVATWR